LKEIPDTNEEAYPPEKKQKQTSTQSLAHIREEEKLSFGSPLEQR